MKTDLFNDSGAIISEDGKHRFSLWRIWDRRLKMVMFIGVNPSTADAIYDDATITRCINFAKAWGYGGMYFGNLFSFRTREPKILLQNFGDSVREETDTYLREMISKSAQVVCAWGKWNFTVAREAEVLSMIYNPYCLSVNKDGSPKHPLYCKSTLVPMPFNINAEAKKLK